MSQVIARVNFYEVVKCGYYSAKDRKHAFCSIQELLIGLHKWTRGKEFGHTQTFSPPEDSQQSKIYCYDICIDNTGSTILTTWNGYDTNEDNTITAINSFAKVGSIGKSDIQASDFTEGYIPGFGTYFWFPSEKKNIFATICFEGRQNGRKDMSSYLEAFLAVAHPEYVFSDEEGGFCYGRSENDDGDYLPMFSAKPSRLPGAIQQIRARCKEITKLLQQVDLNPLIRTNDKTIWQNWLSKIGLGSPSVRSHPISFDAKIGWTPTRSELDSIINEWSKNSDAVGRIGVMFKGDVQPYWFDTCLAKSTIPLEVEKNEHGIVDAESLLAALTMHKDKIFAQAYKK